MGYSLKPNPITPEMFAIPRMARLRVKGKPAVCHVISRTALDDFVLGDTDQ